MYEVVKKYNAVYVMMHMRGTPETMSGLACMVLLPPFFKLLIIIFTVISLPLPH